MTCPSVVVRDAPLRSVAYTSSANCPGCLRRGGPLYSATAPYQPPSEAGRTPPAQAPGVSASTAAAPRTFCHSLSFTVPAGHVQQACRLVERVMSPAQGDNARNRARRAGTTAYSAGKVPRGQVHQPVSRRPHSARHPGAPSVTRCMRSPAAAGPARETLAPPPASAPSGALTPPYLGGTRPPPGQYCRLQDLGRARHHRDGQRGHPRRGWGLKPPTGLHAWVPSSPPLSKVPPVRRACLPDQSLAACAGNLPPSGASAVMPGMPPAASCSKCSIEGNEITSASSPKVMHRRR